MEVMMVALAAQKIFDPMYRTSESAKKILDGFGSEKAKDVSSSKDISEVFTKVNSINSSDERFLKWRELFTKTKQTNIDEEDVLQINEDDSLIGWTAANRLKELSSSDELSLQLRTIYKTQWRNESYENTVRWRAVRALGSFDSKKNAGLLFEALDSDPFHWIRYGAARSLVEMAVITEDELRRSILGRLRERLPKLKLQPNILEEIGGSANRMNAPESWEEQMFPLLEKCKELREGEEHVNRWTKIIEEFKEGKWKNKA